jgi:hypothetical protein
MKRAVVALFLLALAVPLLASGCGDDEEAPSPAVTVELPQGFPDDFPLWDKAAIAVAGEAPGAAQGQGYVVGLESKESAEAARAFYEGALAEQPWQVENVLEIPASEVGPPSPEPSPAVSPEPSAPAETTIIEFSRTDGSQTGTLAISELQTNGRQTIIAVSLTVLR